MTRNARIVQKSPAPPTTECRTCHEQIPSDVAEAIGALYKPSHALSTELLTKLIVKLFRERDEPESRNGKRSLAEHAIETWLGCKLSTICDAVSHVELDSESMWCENCNRRCDESEIVEFGTTFLCGECYISSTARPEDEERL